MIEQLPEKYDRWGVVKEHKWGILGGIIFLLVVFSFIMLYSGNQDCEITSLRDGVLQTCDCRGLTITVKSITNSGEKKTVCLGRVAKTTVFKER